MCCRCWLVTSSCRDIKEALQPSSCSCWTVTSSRPENFRSWQETATPFASRNCDDAGTLVQILGYRLREGCGSKTFFLETANPERAFLTIDSGFPLTELEESLQKGVPFVYPYAPSQVPVMFKESRLDPL